MPSTALGYNFEPTMAEFQRWPYFCQAMYARTSVAKGNGFWKMVPKSDADKWFKIGDKNGGAWHYCTGLTHLDQGEASLNPHERERKFRGAIADIMFSVTRTDNTSSWMALYMVGLGRAYRGLEQYDEAIKVLSNSITDFPKHLNAYTLLSLVYRDTKNLSAAKDVLIAADKISNGKSAEINYFLGLVAVDLGDLEEARRYADKARKLGYPLKGLHNKIKRHEKERNK